MKQITHLIPATQFVIDTVRSAEYSGNELINILYRYSLFLNSPLEIGMFVPASEHFCVLHEPNPNDFDNPVHYKEHLEAYEEAASKVMFERFEPCNRGDISCVMNDNTHISEYILKKYTVEYLAHNYNIKLTPAALKEIYNT